MVMGGGRGVEGCDGGGGGVEWCRRERVIDGGVERVEVELYKRRVGRGDGGVEGVVLESAGEVEVRMCWETCAKF